MVASRAATVLSPLDASGAAVQRSVGGRSSSSGAASLPVGGSSRIAGGRASAAAGVSSSSTERSVGSSSAVESVLDWLSSGEVCGNSAGEQRQPAQPAQQAQQPGLRPSLLAGLQFATGRSSKLRELGSGPHAVTYCGRMGGQDVATKGGLLLLVSDLVHGRSLQAALQQPEQRRQLAWAARGREVALAVADALCHLHGTLRMAHGNLSASNILLADSSRILVTDAGLAALLSSPPPTHAQHAAAPWPHAEHAALAADVLCLGELLGTMLAPQPDAPPNCPAAVAAMIQACRSQDPQQRPTAREVLHCLRQAIAGPAEHGTTT
ncbi:hypothetical protein COHA_003848 [Chlorella ohadii]|uniref:Protein kinase domain-containing protein n=1 Tax=Chlorella ohadii TaxID=2649997 RepID=A0AAD5H331_9CHLO|nr:hypothetical protein COHA_003848 [Chlorella ohadii]